MGEDSEERIGGLLREDQIRASIRHAEDMVRRSMGKQRAWWKEELRRSRVALRVHEELRTRQTQLPVVVHRGSTA